MVGKAVNDRTYDDSYQLVGVTDENGNKIDNFIDLYDLLERVLTEVIDNMFRMALGQCTADKYKYVSIGGKSINLYIKQQYLKKSFDFDIHLYRGDERNIDIFGMKMAKNLRIIINETLPLFRHYIFNILKRYGLVTDREADHYLNEHNQLFYYGERLKPRFSIKGIFFHFLFKDNLIRGRRMYSNDLPIRRGVNEIYYPISDIDLEEDLNFGLPIMDDQYYIDAYDNVRYSKYIITLHNLIKYTESSWSKQEKNFAKLQHFSIYPEYTCYSLKKYSDQYQDDLNEIRGEIRTVIGDDIPRLLRAYSVNGNIVFSPGRNLDTIIQDYITPFMGARDIFINRCERDLVLNHDDAALNTNKIFTDGFKLGPRLRLLGQLETELYNTDVNRYLLYYTGAGFTPIGTFCDYRYFGLDADTVYFEDVYFDDEKLKLSHGAVPPVNTNESIDDLPNKQRVVDAIDELITRVKTSATYTDNLDKLQDEFTVFRLQNFVCFNSPNGDQFNVSTLKPNTIIYMPRYLSTSYVTNYDYDSFLYNNTFLLRIKVNKNSPNWIFINRYSAYPDEHEILINRNCYFVVTNTTTLPVVSGDDYRDILTIDVTMCDRLDDAIRLTGGDAVLIGHHDADIPRAIKKYRITVEPFISAAVPVLLPPPGPMLGGDVPVLPKTQSSDPILSQAEPKSILTLEYPTPIKMKLHNLNMLIYWDNRNKQRHGVIDSLTTDLLNYHNLLAQIYGSKSSQAYKTINKAHSTTYTLEENQLVRTPPSKPIKSSVVKKYPVISSKNILSQIYSQPLGTASIPAFIGTDRSTQQGGDPYYRKYLKYKSKYLDAKSTFGN